MTSMKRLQPATAYVLRILNVASSRQLSRCVICQRKMRYVHIRTVNDALLWPAAFSRRYGVTSLAYATQFLYGDAAPDKFFP